MDRHQRGLTVDEALKLLAVNQRRRVLRYLLEEADSPVYRDELAEKIDDGETSDSGSMEVVLAHHHLPRLADAGVIEYDHRSGGVRLTEAAEDLRPLLDTIERELEVSEA